jgi:predicted dehydrogenase
LENTGEGHVVAAASKSMHRAKRLQKKLGIPQVYDCYEEMLVREKLDAVYIATSHNFHYENAKLCLNHGLPVLIEKAFTRNEKEAEELIDLARQTRLFCMEAMWTRFNPSTRKVYELIADGAIGEGMHLRAAFCVRMRPGVKTLPWNRMYSPHLAGGTLLDIGVYPIAYASMIFGQRPERMTSAAQIVWTGVDTTSEYHFEYSGGRRADLISSFVEDRPREAVITGTHGIIRVPHFSGADRLMVTRTSRAPETIEWASNGFEQEIREVHRCLREGLVESPLMPLRETQDIMRTMDTLRSQWGMKYPGE